MGMKLPKLSEGNFEIMKVIWQLGEATVASVLEHINHNRRKKIGRTSILVQLTRLREYGWLQARKEGRGFIYSAAVDQETATREIVSDIKERVFGGSHSEMFRYLFDEKSITKSDIDELKSMLNDLDGESS